MFNWQTAEIIDIQKVTKQTSVFTLCIEDCVDFKFVPGQFITFDLPIHEKKTKRLKSYSIASHPNGTNIIELVIVQLEGGLGTGYLFDQTKCTIGTKLTFRGPSGVFVLPKDLSVPHYFICTGTGIAPFRSMIKHIVSKAIPFKEIHIVFGSRTKADILYLDEMKKIADDHTNFHFHVALSREEYAGKKGYVHTIYKTLIQDQKHAQFMLCGWRPMIDQARKELSALNYTKEQIHFELYG